MKITNAMKYKTAKERTDAFDAFCDSNICDRCLFNKECDLGTHVASFAWLELEAEEERPLPCPFCGHLVVIESSGMDDERYQIRCKICGYGSSCPSIKYNAIAEHNRVARAVMAEKDKEVK